VELIEGEIPHRNILAFAIFGDGPFDKRILREILRRFDGKHSVLVPTLGFTVIGGQRAVRAVAWLIDNKQKFSMFPSEIWIIIDREHKKELLESLKIYFQCRGVLERGSVLKMSVSRTGIEYVDLVVVLMGKERRIEENIAILIKEHMKMDVKPDKREIGKILRERGITLRELIMRSEKKELKKAFGELIDMLENYEKQCGGPNGFT